MRRLKPYLLLAVLVGCGGDDKCDPVGQTGCDSGQVCETVSGGEPACFAPVAIEGRVFDIDSDAAVASARVVAVDINGAAVSNVVTSNTDGSYRLPIPTERNADGTPVKLEGSVTLRADAKSYESFPGTVRQPLPIDIASATMVEDRLVVKSTLTDIAMSKLADGGTAGRIEGKVEVPEGATGIVVVAESGGTGYATVAARNGDYAILNVPAASYTVTAYSVDHNYTGGSADVNNNTVKVDLKLSADAASPISGQISIVDGGGASMTSIVLFIESTYDPLTGRGVTVPGLRAPRTGAPDITGAFTMDGVPAGKYVIVAAFENDGLVRDPDLCQAGTDDVHIAVEPNMPLMIPDAFKITGALAVLDPGATGAQMVSGTPTFSWVDDSSEDQYLVELFDSYGERVWMKSMPGVSGGTPSMLYDGPALISGMFYQFRTTSLRSSGSTQCPISRTEDLKGIFYLP
ncbi:MAG TPA: carboxypeptidase-like regulatory domain-containing protein [Kofleriaceae bacterium]